MGVNNLEPAFGLSVVKLGMGNSGSRLAFSRGNGLHLDVRCVTLGPTRSCCAHQPQQSSV